MKYQKLGTRVLGYLSPNTNVTVTLVDIKQDKILHVETNVCFESTVLPGLYIFDTNHIDLLLLDDVYKLTDESLEIAYMMTNELNEKYGGKVVIDSDLKLLMKIDNAITKLPEGVWEMLSLEDQQTYTQILRRIYQNTDMIPSIV